MLTTIVFFFALCFTLFPICKIILILTEYLVLRKDCYISRQIILLFIAIILWSLLFYLLN